MLREDNLDIVGPPVRLAPRLVLRRASDDLPSRVADNLFWLGRYVERLDRAPVGRISRMPGWGLGWGRSMAGWIWTRPITWWYVMSMWCWRGGGITAISARCAGLFSAAGAMR